MMDRDISSFLMPTQQLKYDLVCVFTYVGAIANHRVSDAGRVSYYHSDFHFKGLLAQIELLFEPPRCLAPTRVTDTFRFLLNQPGVSQTV